jgi:hypothetical protein
VTIRADGAETAFGNFRVRPKFVIRKSVRLRINLAVGEDSIAVLTIQSPLSLRHSVTFWRGAGLAVTNNAKTQNIEDVPYRTLETVCKKMFEFNYWSELICVREMPRQPQATIAEMLSDFRGLYARVARNLNISASMVSRVADGKRASAEIDAALREELKALKAKLDKYL